MEEREKDEMKVVRYREGSRVRKGCRMEGRE